MNQLNRQMQHWADDVAAHAKAAGDEIWRIEDERLEREATNAEPNLAFFMGLEEADY